MPAHGMGIPILLIIILIVGICFGLMIGLMLGFSHAIREAAGRLHGARSPVLARIVIGLGCAALVGALALWLHAWHFTHIAQRTSGAVAEMREQIDKDSGSVSYAPTFHFKDANGAEHTVSSSFFSSRKEFHVGDRVTVIYRGDDPQTASIDTYWQVWGLPSLAGITGSIDLSAGLILLFWPKITGRIWGRLLPPPAIPG